MPDKVRMSKIRADFPMYNDVPDDQLLIALRKKFYSDIPPEQFYSNIEYDTERQRLNKAQLDEMGWGGQFLAGAGKALSDVRSTVRKLTDPEYRASGEAEEQARLDKPLEDTSGGFWGNLAGEVGLTAIPGYRAAQGVTKAAQAGARMLPRALGAQAAATAAAPFVGAAAGGAGVGAATTPEDVAGGAQAGALFGAGGELGGRVLSSAYGGAKGVFEPLYQKGRERILKRTLERYATDPAKVKAAIDAGGELVPGARPTLAEVTGDQGLAQLQRSAQAASPDVASALHESNLRRIGAYRTALDDIAGTPEAQAKARGELSAAGERLYEKAFARKVDLTKVDPEIALRAQALLSRPSIKRAIPRAMDEAAEMGLEFDGASSIRGMHQIKMALDNEIGEKAIAGQNTNALQATRDQLVELMDALSGGHYGQAREGYKVMARPVNQMDIAEQLKTKAFPALNEYSPDLVRTTPTNFARALEDSQRTVRAATGLKNSSLEQMMEPQQLATVQNIAKDMARNQAAQEAARIPGSPTGQLMASQNILRGILGPLGLPQGVLDAQVSRIASGIVGLPYRWTEPQLQQMLAQAFTDPQTAKRLLEAQDPRTVVEVLQPYMSQMAVQLGNQE